VLSIIGFVIVVGAILGGYLMEGGLMHVLMQPAEFLIIGGAAFGSLLIANGPSVIRSLVKQLAGFMASGPGKTAYLELLVMFHEILTLMRRDGLIALEAHIEKPHDSALLKKYPGFLHKHHAVDFLTDTMRLLISGENVEPYDLAALMDEDMATHHDEETRPARVLQVVGDALPGLGIVAAVLGIVITMAHIDGPPAEIGHRVGAALVGTFLGVLLSYGFVQPLAAKLAATVDDAARYLVAIKQVILAFHRGCMPATAVEFARRSLPHEVRPSYGELEEQCRAAMSAASSAGG
jgi:chemotaxis protein MotA